MTDSGERRPNEIDHALESCRRTPRRSPALYVIPSAWRPMPGRPLDEPGGRDNCRNGPRPCPYVECPMHLWVTDGHDRVGRPSKAKKSARYVRAFTPASCALDLSDRGEEMTTTQIGKYFGVGRERVRLIVNAALRKLGATAEDLVGYRRRKR